MVIRKLIITLFIFLFDTCVANNILYEYAIGQTSEISPDILCKEEENHVACEIRDIEWIEGIVVKKFQYNIIIKNEQLIKTRYFELKTNNLNFEGYNLSRLMPNSILCTEKSILAKNNNMQNNKNIIKENIDCTLKSKAYHIVVTANFKTHHPMYNDANNILEARIIERERFIKPLDTTQDENWTKEYYIYPISATIWIKSYSLNQILFDLYRREQRIATNEAPQNDRDYKTIQDSALFKDYSILLHKSHDILKTLQQEHIHKNTQLVLSKIINSFILVATKPNQNLSIAMNGNKGFVLSLDEIDNLVDIDDKFFSVIIKILKHTTIKTAK